ncbi:MAG: O-antigen ligase family protein [Pseudoxanthomonas sp.]
MGLTSAAAFVFLPNGMAAFAMTLVAGTLLVPQLLVQSWRQYPRIFGSFAGVSLLVVGVAIMSMQATAQGWQTVDNYSRFLLLPWCAVLAFAAAPSRAWLWFGALAGVFIACAMASMEMWWGIDRAGAGANPIVFANAVLALLVLAVYCRPQNDQSWALALVIVTLVAGTAAIVMSGSRGALPGLGMLVLVAAFGKGGRTARFRLGLALLLLLVFLALLCTVPWLTTHMRLGNIQIDLMQYADGHADSALGARLQFLSLAWHAFVEHLWTGVGIDRFGTLVQQLPACRVQGPVVCTLGHAHNDLAQWSSTLGIPGLIAILALYLVPAFNFMRIIVKGRLRVPLGCAWAGLMLVVVYVLSGLTQSMFSHAMTTSLYVVLIGLLLGLALREANPATRGPERQSAR